MMELFSRPSGGFSFIESDRIAHHQLWNPPLSGYLAEGIRFDVDGCSGGFRIGVIDSSVGMLDDATFPESRGLPINPDATRPYSVCHSRRKKCNPYILIGQRFSYPDSSRTIHWPGHLIPGTGLLVIANHSGVNPTVNWLWGERVLP